MVRKSRFFPESLIKLLLAGLLISMNLMWTAIPVSAATNPLAGWDGSGSNPPFLAISSGAAGNPGTAALSAVGLNGPYPPYATSSGGPAGEKGLYIANGWVYGSGTKYWEVHFSSTGFQNLTVSSQQYSTDSTTAGWDGPRDFKLQYSTNHSTWADVSGGGLTMTGNWDPGGRLTNLPLPAALNNQASVYLRWIMTSNASVGTDGFNENARNQISGIYIRGEEIASAPTDIQLSRTSLLATDPVGTVVGNFSVTDSNVYETWTYSLISGTGSTNNGSFSITGNQLTNTAVLSAGTYSIRVNVFDGIYNFPKIFTITVRLNDNYLPMTGGSTDFNDYITNVTFAGINNNSGKAANPTYTDYTGGTAASVKLGSGYSLSVTVNVGCPNPPVAEICGGIYYPQYIKAWIDWNQDRDFDEADEGFVINANASVSGTYPITVNVPLTAALGATRMRVINNGDDNDDHIPPEPPNHGGGIFYGEAEDYTVNVAAPVTSSIAPTSIQNINTSTNGAALTVTETPAADSRQWKYGTVSGGPYSSTIGGATGTSYTPNFAVAGTYYIVCASTKNGYIATSNEVRVNVGTPPSFTSANHSTFLVGTAGSFLVNITPGSPAATTLSQTGALPSGVTFTDNGNGTATLSGTPSAGTGGTYPLTLTASNGVSTNATQSFTLTVNQAPAITSANHTTFTVGSSGSFTVTTTAGFPVTMTLSESGTLPSGVTFTDNGNGTATLAGTPSAGTGGSYPLTLTANNGIGANATQSFTLTVNQAPAITSANAVTFSTGMASTFTITTSGYPTGASMVLSQTGTLPSGVTFTDNGNGTASLAGTPSAGTGGAYPISLTASNGVSPNATQSFTLTVNQPPTITSANHATFIVGSAGSFTITTNGYPNGASMAISKAGGLPGGVTFTNNGNGTATLSGTPSAGTGGSYLLSLTASNGVSPNATQSFTLTVNQAPAVTSANHTTFLTGSPGSFTVTTSGYPTGASMTITKAAGLPGGVTFTNNGNGTATLAGTPSAGSGGTYLISITASNGVSPDAIQSFTLTVNQAPTITSANNVAFSTGSAGTFTITTDGYPKGASMVITRTGTLPSGVTFTDNGNGTATLAGTPSAETGGTYPLTLTANNGVGSNASQSFTLTVRQLPTITSADHATFVVGTSGSFTVTTTPGFPIATALGKTGALPSGVTFVDNGNGTATLSGTPAADTGGTYSISIAASNGVGSNSTQSFTLTVNQSPAITSANAVTFSTGLAGSFTVTTIPGYPVAMTLSESGTLPSGVTFTDKGNGTASLAGTPGAATTGTYPLLITASNGIGSDVTQSFTLTVQDATVPVVNTFSADPLTNSLDIPITAFTATDNVSVTGYMITASSTAPTAANPSWAASAPTTYSVASAGSYTLYPWVKDAAGSVSAVFGSPASVLVDLTPPDTSIAANPPDPDDSFDAVFSFGGSDSGGSGLAGFECDLDAGGFVPCTSPLTYTGLRNGSHTFQVRAVDGARNIDPTPAEYTWTIQSQYLYYFPLIYR